MTFHSLITDRSQLPVDQFDWGTLQWLCSERLSPGAAQTVGLCHILPGKRNPIHYHPNCEEILHVLAGQGDHSLEGETLQLTAGMTLRIPTGVRHNLANTGAEPLLCLIVFSSGDRQTVFLE